MKVNCVVSQEEKNVHSSVETSLFVQHSVGTRDVRSLAQFIWHHTFFAFFPQRDFVEEHTCEELKPT